MSTFKYLKIIVFCTFISLFLSACNGKFPGGDARKFPDDPKKRVEQNLKEGRGFKLNNMLEGEKRGGVFDFASSNPLWRASLDVIDFMPLSSVNYSGGIIITDWYSDNQNQNESIKISIRFLTNEIRSDALDIKVFTKLCDVNNKCTTSVKSGELTKELKKKILKRAKTYEVQNKDKNFKPYETPKITK